MQTHGKADPNDIPIGLRAREVSLFSGLSSKDRVSVSIPRQRYPGCPRRDTGIHRSFTAAEDYQFRSIADKGGRRSFHCSTHLRPLHTEIDVLLNTAEV